MKQIKVKELPKDWLVLDHHIESGPADFVSYETVSEANDEFEECEDGCLNCWANEICWKGNLPNETFGTKHIQLIDVNTDIEWFWEGPIEECYFIDRDGYGIYKGADVLSASGCKQDCKDFFIYKVTEVVGNEKEIL